MAHELDAAAIRQLLDPAAWPAADKPPRLIETHISWVILAGEFAYKVKKPVSLGFLDFSTRALRKHYCEEELRLNRRTAPELYLDVVPIGRTAAGLRVGAEPAVDYAVKMRRFPEKARLDHCLRAGRLGPADMRELAAMIAGFHDGLAPRINRDAAFAAERASKPALNNFKYLRENLGRRGPPQLERVKDWGGRQIEALRPVFAARAAGGFVRECHGDLHLANLLRLEGRFRAFDCIEFDEGLRRIDTANDMAFLVMDLEAHDRDDLAHAVLSAWLEANGDYAGLQLTPYYLVFRAMVRAVVASIRQGQENGSAADAGDDDDGVARYLDLAAALIDPPPPTLFLMHGFSGSGKTWLSERLIPALPALRVRSDLERKRLQREGAIGGELYGAAATRLTYETLAAHCEAGLCAGFSMIADATFLRREPRARFLELARSLGLPAVIVDCDAAPDVLRQRLRRRAAQRRDASDADVAVLNRQLADHDAFDAAERRQVLKIDTEGLDQCSLRDWVDRARKEYGIQTAAGAE